MTDIVVVTGLSGAGRSQVADDLEDLGWFVVDNLPVVLVDKVVELTGESGGEVRKLCLVVGNVREQTDVLSAVTNLRAAMHHVRVLYLEASPHELVRRYEATRRKHPLAEPGLGLEALIGRERAMLGDVRAAADLVIDTTGLTVHQLRAQIVSLFGPESPSTGLALSFVSFGYKYGLPLDVDVVLDVSFLPNPHWVDSLRPLSGLDAAVREHVLDGEASRRFLDRAESLLEMMLPECVAEGRSYLTVAVGCTGGRHRSVAVVEELARRMSALGYSPRIAHRDMSAH